MSRQVGHIGFADGGVTELHPIGESVELHADDCLDDCIYDGRMSELLNQKSMTFPLGNVEIPPELQSEFDELRRIRDMLNEELAKMPLVSFVATPEQIEAVIERMKEQGYAD